MGIKEDEEFAFVHLVTSALYLVFSKCPRARYPALLQEDVFVNPEIIESFAIAENMAANRVYGDLYRDYGPSRDPTTNHYVSRQTWPWPRLPPFLGPSFLFFSSDTLPRLLQVLPQVWLSGLVAIKAEVLRIG